MLPSVDSHAFLWRNGAMEDLGTLGGSNSCAYDINDLNQVVGDSETGDVGESGLPVFHGFLWQNGVRTDLGTLGGATSSAFGINNRGQIVGQAAPETGGSRACL